MTRRYLLSLGLAGLLWLPASVANACHLDRVSVELSCTQFKFMAKGMLLPHAHSIRYSFSVTPTTGGAPVTVSKIIPVSGPPGASAYAFDESATEQLSLVGNFDAKSFSGSASLISPSGDVESTTELSLPQTTLKCTPVPQS